MDHVLTKPRQDAVTVRRLRRGIGLLGMALPFVLAIGNAVITGSFTLLGSISAYYHTGMRDVFVGAMCAIGIFLICYRYERLDDVLSSIAGVLAIVVALVPATQDETATAFGRAVGQVHLLATAALFLLLAYFCFFVFTKKAPGKAVVTTRKRIRNAIYVLCGLIILAAIAIAVASRDLPEATRDVVKPLFWCETAAILAFGLAWMVKSGLFLRDTFPGTALPRRRTAMPAAPTSPAVPASPTTSLTSQ